MIEYKSGERLGYIKKSPHSPECVSSIYSTYVEVFMISLFMEERVIALDL